MRYLLCFQVNKNKALQYVIVKHKVNIIVLLLRMDMLLPCNKSIAFSKLFFCVPSIR